MTKDVLVSISGLQMETLEEGVEHEPIEIITPASYFCKNGKHYILYDEVAEGMSGVTRNKIKISSQDKVEVVKTGVVSMHMIFEKHKRNLTYYHTPYGQIPVGIHTSNMEIQVKEDSISVKVDYELDINHETWANCEIRMNIKSKNTEDFALM
ncbi:MAG: DUF1934 domain-containing protein [Lachnospiraceae bacterium]